MASIIKPLLYINDLGRTFPKLEIVGWGAKPFDFIWDDKRGAHVRRYESMEAFKKEQFDLIGRQKKWPVFFDVEVTEEGEAADQVAQIEELTKAKALLSERIELLEAALRAADEQAAQIETPIEEEDAEAIGETPFIPPPAPQVAATEVAAPAQLDVPPPPAVDPAPAPKKRRNG
jgi:hypothetical protein